MLPVARGKSEASVLRGSIPQSGIPSVALQVVPPILGEAELTAQVFVEWCNQRGITRYYIQPWEPVQHASIERFNRTYREEILNAYPLSSTLEAQRLSDAWLVTTTSTGRMTRSAGSPPLTYLPRVASTRESKHA